MLSLPFLENMTSKQYLKIKSSIINTNNCFNGTFLLFNILNSKFSSGTRLIDSFPSHFSFHRANHKDKKSKNTHLINLIKIFTKPHQKLTQLSLSQMPVSKIMSPLPLSMFTLTLILSRRHFITLLTLPQLKQNYSQSDVGLVKLSNSLTFPISLSSPTLSMQLKESLILPFILINYNWLLFLKTSDCISIDILTIPLNSGITLATISGHSIY